MSYISSIIYVISSILWIFDFIYEGIKVRLNLVPVLVVAINILRNYEMIFSNIFIQWFTFIELFQILVEITVQSIDIVFDGLEIRLLWILISYEHYIFKFSKYLSISML